MTVQLLAAGPSAQALTVTVIGAVLGSSLLAALLTAVITGLRGLADARRDGYASAIEAVVAWAEFPYRVRRRTDNDPATLTRLADLGSNIQENLARRRAWVETESSAVAAELAAVINAVKTRVGESTNEAWTSEPVSSAAGMNISPFGPGDLSVAFDRLHAAVKWRFGMRRAVPNWVVRLCLSALGAVVLPAPPVSTPPTSP